MLSPLPFQRRNYPLSPNFNRRISMGQAPYFRSDLPPPRLAPHRTIILNQCPTWLQAIFDATRIATDEGHRRARDPAVSARMAAAAIALRADLFATEATGAFRGAGIRSILPRARRLLDTCTGSVPSFGLAPTPILNGPGSLILSHRSFSKTSNSVSRTSGQDLRFRNGRTIPD